MKTTTSDSKFKASLREKLTKTKGKELETKLTVYRLLDMVAILETDGLLAACSNASGNTAPIENISLSSLATNDLKQKVPQIQKMSKFVNDLMEILSNETKINSIGDKKTT